jgi:hormone-sensitive lipase
MSAAQHFAVSCKDSIIELLQVLPSVQPLPSLPELTVILQAICLKVDELQLKLAEGEANPASAEAVIHKLLYYVFQTDELTQKWLASWEEEDEEDVSIVLGKFTLLHEMIDSAASTPSDDLIFIPRSDPRWVRLRRCIESCLIAGINEILEATDEFVKNIAVSQAFMSKGFEVEEDSYQRKLTVGAGMLYYGLSREAALRRCRYFYSKPNSNAAFAVWNIPDSQLVSPLYSTLCPSIEVSTVVFLPRVYGEDHSTKHFSLDWDHLPSKVPVRLISDVPIKRLAEFDPVNCCQAPKSPQFFELVIHIHGGGFVSMSSASHQSYTRKWAKVLQVPIISIDYRLAPKHKYPAAADDVWDAYVWLITHAETELGIRPDRVVLVGDSAGGNLALAVTNRAIESGHRVPDGLLLAYPCVTLNRKAFSPAIMLSLEDMLIPYSFIEMCLKAYLSDSDDPCTDYYLSPLLSPAANLVKFPSTRLISGTNDPLYDDSLRFVERLLDAGVDVKVREYEGLLHGFLSYDMKIVGIEICSVAVEDAGEMLKELLTGACLD